jgi:hypothetical protein
MNRLLLYQVLGWTVQDGGVTWHTGNKEERKRWNEAVYSHNEIRASSEKTIALSETTSVDLLMRFKTSVRYDAISWISQSHPASVEFGITAIYLAVTPS